MAGVFWSIVSGVGFGLFQVLNRRAGRYLDTYFGTFILLLVSAVILVAAALATEDLRLLQEAPMSAYANFALAGIVHFFVGWTLISVSQKRVGAARTGAFVGAAPLFGALIAALFLGEFLNLLTLLGIFLVVGGVFLVSNG